MSSKASDDTNAETPWGDIGGWNRALGLRLIHVAGDRVVAEWDVAEQHHQPYGIVHGGVHCSVIESICSIGAAVHVIGQGLSVVGLDNHTSFIRAVRNGRLTATATPITRGRRTQLWEAVVVNEAGQTVATGRVRLLCLEPETSLAGKTVSLGGA